MKEIRYEPVFMEGFKGRLDAARDEGIVILPDMNFLNPWITVSVPHLPDPCNSTLAIPKSFRYLGALAKTSNPSQEVTDQIIDSVSHYLGEIGALFGNPNTYITSEVAEEIMRWTRTKEIETVTDFLAGRGDRIVEQRNRRWAQKALADRLLHQIILAEGDYSMTLESTVAYAIEKGRGLVLSPEMVPIRDMLITKKGASATDAALLLHAYNLVTRSGVRVDIVSDDIDVINAYRKMLYLAINGAIPIDPHILMDNVSIREIYKDVYRMDGTTAAQRRLQRHPTKRITEPVLSGQYHLAA